MSVFPQNAFTTPPLPVSCDVDINLEIIFFIIYFFQTNVTLEVFSRINSYFSFNIFLKHVGL